MRKIAFVVAVLLVMSAFPVMGLASADDAVVLEGSAEKVGRLWGEINRDSIINAYEAFMENAKGKEDLLRNFAKLSINLSKEIGCSYWIEELNAIADTADLDRELYIAFTFGRYRDLALLYEGVGCTSFAVVSPATKDGQIIFHKTRETSPDLQSAYLKKITDVPSGDKKPYKFFGEMGTADTGVSFFVNEKGLAGGADVPRQWQHKEYYVDPAEEDKPFVDPPKYDGFMNHYIPRYIAEHCKDVDEAGRVLHDFVDKGYIASGKWGTNYLFVDAKGQVLQIADDCREIVEERKNPVMEVEGEEYKGIYFTVHRENDYGTPEDALVSNYGGITVELVNSPSVSKHPAMWNFARAQSSSTILIDPEYPSELTTIFVSLPAYGYGVPFFMGAQKTPRALMDGTVYDTQLKSYNYSEFYEAGINDIWRKNIFDFRKKLENGEDVTKELDAFSLEMVNLILSMNR